MTKNCHACSHSNLVLWWKCFNGFLNHSAPVHLKSQEEDIALELLNQNNLLLIRSKLKELLDDIVGIFVIHQWVDFMREFIKYHLFLISIDTLKLLLDKSGSILVFGKLQHMTTDIIKLKLMVKSSKLQHDLTIAGLAREELQALIMSRLLLTMRWCTAAAVCLL